MYICICKYTYTHTHTWLYVLYIYMYIFQPSAAAFQFQVLPRHYWVDMIEALVYMIYMTWSLHKLESTWVGVYRSRRRSYLKYLDLQILRFSPKIFWVPGTPFTHVKICLKIWGLPWKRVWSVRGFPWKHVWNFGSRNYFKSYLLGLWLYTSWNLHELESTWVGVYMS